MNNIVNHVLVNLVNEFKIENYQTADDFYNFIENFIKPYQLSSNEFIILMALFKHWLIENHD